MSIIMNTLLPILKSSKVIKRYEGNPILSDKDCPFDCDLLFNAGVTKFKGKYIMVFRNDYNYKERFFGVNKNTYGTNLGIAYSEDGIKWEVKEKPFFTMDSFKSPLNTEIMRLYDPRLTVIEDKCYMCFAVDSRHGILGGIAEIDDSFESFKILSMSTPDNRNMVLFPEKINGLYARLERPFPIYGRGKCDLWISYSPDLKYWGDSDLVLGVEQVPFANDKVGPAAPPIKTSKGWLTTFHAVDTDNNRGKNGWEPKWPKRYTTGIMLLDLNNPSKIVGMYNEPLIAPEAHYEVDGGFRNNVIFPGGMILEDTGEVKIYYGAADTVECLATANVDDLLDLCK